MAFRILGLNPAEFHHLIGLSETELERFGAKRLVVDARPGYPDRIEVRDLEVGDTAILLDYEHQPVDTPYRSRHAIFVGESADRRLDAIDTLPEAIRIRPISLRAFDTDGNMIEADLAAGQDLEPVIERFFQNPDVAYLHAHYAKRGCYAARIDRG